MSAIRRSAPGLTSIVAFGVVSCLARGASAQADPPNPFEDYERFVAGEPAATPDIPSVSPAALRTAPLTWSLGLRSQLSFSRLTYQRGPEERDGSAMALLFRLSPALNVFVHDRIQIGISPGLLVRSGGTDIGDEATDGNMLIEASAHYFAPLLPRLSFVPGLGVGGYFGSGTRKSDAGADGSGRVDRGTETSGLSLVLYMGIAYQLDRHFQIRSGLTGSVYFGWDRVQGRDERVQNTATHIGIPVELFYVF